MIALSETETIWLIDIPATCVAEGSEEMEKVKAMNENYEKVLLTPLSSSITYTFHH